MRPEVHYCYVDSPSTQQFIIVSMFIKVHYMFRYATVV